jgi:hypothetical protein
MGGTTTSRAAANGAGKQGQRSRGGIARWRPVGSINARRRAVLSGGPGGGFRRETTFTFFVFIFIFLAKWNLILTIF